jgi:hypothetical protein
MSYQRVDYFRNPMPYYDGPSARRTVPGWGQLPRSAGNERVGIGQSLIPREALRTIARQRYLAPTYDDQQQQDDVVVDDKKWYEKVPWWVYLAAPAVVFGGLAVASNMGVFGGGSEPTGY